jgi:serine phosphatase RsbU (regulator of sigma subunit)
LDKKVVETIQKQTKGTQPKDGMDMIVMTFDEISYTVKYAGAKNPLYYVRYNEMHQIKASNFPIGIFTFKKEKKFELHEFQAQQDDIFYLTSDGFQDQLGEKTGRKYLTRNLRALLLEISSLPMPEQKQRLCEALIDWKGKAHQTDDVLVVAIKV